MPSRKARIVPRVASFAFSIRPLINKSTSKFCQHIAFDINLGMPSGGIASRIARAVFAGSGYPS